MPKKDILAKLQALKASASSVSPSVTGMPNPEGTDYFGNMMEGKVPFTLPKATEWPTDNEREGINKSISNIRNQVVAEPRTASDLTDISNPGELTFGRRGRFSNFGPVEPKNPADAGRPVFGPKPTSNMAMAIDQTLREAETLTNSSTEQHDGNSGLIDGFNYADTFTAGGLKAARKNAQAVATKTIEKKVRSGLPLSKEEQLFVDALGLRAKADAMVSSEGGNTISYQTGNVIGQMPEFIAQIVGTAPIGGEVGTAIKGIPLIAKGLKSTAPLWRKGVTLAGIELGKASVVSPLQPMFASNFADQELKQYRIERDESGNVTAERSNPQSVGTSLAKAFAQTLTENWSEGMGEVFGKAGAKIAQGVAKSKLGIRMAGSQLGSTIAKADELIGKATGAIGATAEDFGLGGVKAFTRDMMKWNGTLEEIAEEEFNNVVQPLLMGEPEQLKQLLDMDQQLVTALSCAIAGVGFRALEIPGYVRSGIAINQNKNAYQQNLASISPDVAELVVAAFAEQDIDARGKALSSLPWAEMHPAERESVVSAVWHRTRYDFLRGAKAASDAEQQLGHIKSKTDALIFKGRESRPTEGDSIYTAMLPNGSMGILVDGDIVSEDQEGIEKHYAIPGARKPIVLTEDGRRIMVDHSELSSITKMPSSDIVSTSIDQWMEQQDGLEEQQDMEDADADMQAASLTPALPNAPEEEAPVSSPQPQAPVQPILPAYTPKVGDTVQAPDGIVGKVVQSTPDGSVIAFVDHQGNEQIEVYGHNDGLQQYEGLAPTEEQPAQEELTLPEANTNGAEHPAEPMPAGIAEAELPSASVEAPAAANPENTEPLPTVDAVDSEATASSIAEGTQTLESNPDIQQAMPAIETDAEVMPPSSRGQEDGAAPRSFPELAKEIGSTVNDEPSMEAPHYVSRNRNVFYTVNGGELLIMDRNGTEVPRQQGGRVNPKYTRLAKEYKEVFDYRRGERGTANEYASEEEALSMIIGSSKNPLELATIYLGEMARGNELVRDAETSVTGIILSIAQSSRVSQSGFAEWADPNFVTMTIAKTYFSKNGVNPSDIAALANAELSGEWNATDMVTADDVVQAMLAYPRGAEDFSRQLRESTLAREAARAFASLTGFDITPSVTDKVRTMQLDSTPKVASTQELEQQMADDHWEHFISVAERIGIDIGDDLNAAFSPESLQQINETNVEQDLEKPSQNNDLQATERTESNAARGAASSSDSNQEAGIGTSDQEYGQDAGSNAREGEGADTGDAGEGPKDEPRRPNENSDSRRAGISLTPTQQAQYDKRKGELEREIATLTQQLVDARRSKDKAINEAQMRNGLFGDTASDPRQATIDGGGSLDVLSGVNTITQKHNETISHISRAISNKKRELEGLRNAVMGQAELFGEQPAASEDVPSDPKEQLDVQNHATNIPDASVEEKEAKLDVQKHTTEIDDFGEKLWGARKDMIQKAKESIKSITDDRIVQEPLSKVLPAVDLKVMMDNGLITALEAGMLQYIRNGIGVKPQKRYRMARYVESVNAYVKMLDIVTSRDSIPTPDLADSILDKQKDSDFITYNQLSLNIKLNSLLVGVTGASMFELKQFIGHNGYSLTKGQVIVKDNLTTVEEAAEYVKNAANKKDNSRKDIALKLFQDTKTGDVFIGWKGSTGVLRLQEGFPNVKAANAYLKEHETELVERLEAIKDIPNERRATNADRIGKDYRNGQNVTPDQFNEAFGFRGVQFGNWVEGDRRQQSLNMAYDALMDLANVLGLPTKAISLGGQLGLAFGSRGRGGKYAPAAHYEPSTMVINLTKENGAGSLAHEWWHALDNHFGNINRSTGGFATEQPGKRSDSQLRDEMSAAFRNLRKEISSSQLSDRSAKLDKARSKQYWSTDTEMSARAFEVYVVNRLAAQETTNDYLSNFKDMSTWVSDRAGMNDYPYPTEEEATKINAAFDRLIGSLEHRTESDGSVVVYSLTQQANKQVETSTKAADELAQQISEAAGGVEASHSAMQHLDGTAEQALIEAVAPLAMQWSEADSQRQDALGVLVQSRRISSGLPLLVDELSSTARPENGWNVESAQVFIDQMKAKYPTTNEATAVEDNAAAAKLMRSLGYSEELCSEVEQEHWDGLTLPDGRVLINTANPNLNIAVTWAHEQGHSLMGRIVSEKDRMSIGEAVCNAIGVHDILAYIGNEYASAPIWMIGEEYLMHRIGGTVGGEPITALPATVAQVMEARNGVTQEQVEQIISTLVAQILKDSSNGKGESRRNSNDRDLFPSYQDPLHQNGNEGGVRGVPQADRGGNEPVRGIQQGWENEHHQDRVASAEEQTNTSPSEAQKRAGNYRKGKARILGMEISIENPEGSTRSGVDPNGKAWSITMPQPYGYFLGTVGKDKDHIDVYLGRNLTKDTPVFIINQVNPSTGRLDEHKVMLGYPSYGAAKRAYMAAYEDGWKGFGSMGQMNLDEFKEWAYSGNTQGEVEASVPAEELGDSQEFYNAWHDDDALGLPSDFDSAIAYARRGGVRAPERGMITLEGRMDKLREQVQDATLRVRRLQEHIAQDGGRVPFAANAWESLNRYTSAAKAKMDYFESGELKNLITVAGEICKQVDATWEQLNDYLICKHGIDRQEVGEVMVFSTSTASEWTLENAKRTVADFEQKADAASLDRLWDAVKAATSASLNVLLEGGVVSQKDVDDYQSRKGWERYVPLRDFDASSELRADDIFEYSESRNPQRGTFVKATQTAKGRTSKPNSPIPQIAAMFASSVALAEKNRAKQALLNLVRLNPNRSEYTVTRSWYVLDKGTNTTLEVFEKPKPSLLDLQSACIDFFAAPDIQAKNAMVQQLQDLQQTAIDDGADPKLVGLVMRQGMQDGVTTITTKPHKSSILGETKEQDRQHMVAVFEDGVKYTVWFEDPELAAAVNHTNINTKFSETWFGSTMAAMNRWLSVNFTGKNPAFIPINWIRDVQYATLSHLIRHDGEAARTYANIGRATAAIHRYNTGSANPLTASELAGYSLHNPSHLLHLISSYGKGRVVDTLFEQYRKNGGETGYIHTDDIRAWAKRLRRHLQRELGTNPTVDKLGQAGSKYTGLHAAGRLLDYTAYQSENMVRFATFLASWEQGKGFAEAASDAKNVTVNFNRKGRLSGILNSLMVFFNATVQGTDNLLDRVILPNKWRFAAAASILFAASILAASMAIAAYGDGDDNPYWRMPEFVRYNSLVVPTYGIGGKERFLIIPLPPGLRFLNGWAVAALEGYHGQKSAAEVGSTMASSVIDNTSPIGIKGSDLTRTFIPSIAVPFYDIAINKDYAGRPVYREMFTQELRDNTPNSQQGSRDVNEAFSWFAGWLNELGGGNESVPAGTDRTTGKVSRIKRMLLDINPSKLEHVLSYFAGGRGQFFLDCYKTARPSWDESAELETRNIPVVKRLWGGASPSSDAKAFYERVDNLKRYQYYIDKSFKDGDRSGIKESLVRMDVYRWSQMAETYTEQVQELSRMADSKGVSKEQRQTMLDRRRLLMRQFLNNTKQYERQPENIAEK